MGYQPHGTWTNTRGLLNSDPSPFVSVWFMLVFGAKHVVWLVSWASYPFVYHQRLPANSPSPLRLSRVSQCPGPWMGCWSNKRPGGGGKSRLLGSLLLPLDEKRARGYFFSLSTICPVYFWFPRFIPTEEGSILRNSPNSS